MQVFAVKLDKCNAAPEPCYDIDHFQAHIRRQRGLAGLWNPICVSSRFSIQPLVGRTCLFALAVCLAGCSTARHRASADHEAYASIRDKAPGVPNMPEDFSIDPTAEALTLDDLPTLATADPAMGESAAAEVGAPILTLERALAMAVQRNRQYQGAKENLYLEALNLTLERHRYAPLFNGGATAGITRTAVDITEASDFSEALAEAGIAIDALEGLTGQTADMLRDYAEIVRASGTELGLADSRNETESEVTADGSASVGLDVLLKGGGRFALNLTTNVLRYLLGTGSDTAASALSASFTQPLLRGAGKDVAAERLVQAERSLLYALREFVLFRKDFSVEVCSAYYGVLRERDIVRNSHQSYLNFQKSADRERAFAAEGRRTVAELGRLEQAELSAENDWVNAMRRYNESIDRFKIQLGLSTDAKIVLDDQELARLRDSGLKHPALNDDDAVKVALATRLDLFTSRDQVDDSARKIKVAENSLKPGLDLLASASVDTAGANRPADFELEGGTWSLGADLDLPLDRKAERNNYRASLINHERAQRELSLAEDNVKLQVRAAWRNLDQARRNYDVALKSVELNERRVQEQALLAELGRATVLNQVDAQQDLTRAQNDLTAALVAHNIARLEFWRDMGILYIKENGQWEEINDGSLS